MYIYIYIHIYIYIYTQICICNVCAYMQCYVIYDRLFRFLSIVCDAML